MSEFVIRGFDCIMSPLQVHVRSRNSHGEIQNYISFSCNGLMDLSVYVLYESEDVIWNCCFIF